MLNIFLADSTAIPATCSAVQSTLPPSTFSITFEQGDKEQSQQVTRASDGDPIKVGDGECEKAMGVDEGGAVDFSTLASDFIDSFWTLDAMTTLLQGDKLLSYSLPFLF
jgi:hypothetical protein